MLANLAAVMGRAAVHSRMAITWDEMLASKFLFCDYVDQMNYDSPVQSFPDMISEGCTICMHPFSQVCKNLGDPEGDSLWFKAEVSSTMKRYLPA